MTRGSGPTGARADVPSGPETMSSGATWTDSHCHLAMEDFDVDRDDVIRRAGEAAVERLVVVGTNPEDWAAAASWGARRGIRATAGLHPHEAWRWSSAQLAGLEEALGHPGVSAVGEIGLDFHYDLSPRAVQREAFEAQVELAARRGLPVVVHSREAFEDTLAVLGAAPGLRGVIHCFTYGPAEAEAFLASGLLLSFSGILTFPKAPLVQESARLAPLGRILVETDAPYLAPAPFRGKRCEPAHTADVGRFLARLKGVSDAEAAAATSANAADLFGFLEGERMDRA